MQRAKLLLQGASWDFFPSRAGLDSQLQTLWKREKPTA